MIDHRKELKEALQIHRKRKTFDAQQREEAVGILAQHGIWSMVQIGAISNAPASLVYAVAGKTDRTGGRFNPDTLELLLEEIALKDSSEVNVLLTSRIAEMGTSSYMIAKLTGIHPATVKYRIASGKRVSNA